MVRKALALLVVVAVVGVVGAVGLWIPGLVGAHGHSATRSFSATSVPAGGDLTVTIVARGFGSIGSPCGGDAARGFEYQSSSMPASQAIPDTDDPQIRHFRGGPQVVAVRRSRIR